MTTTLKSPYPWFGGKSRVAPLVWSTLGPVDHLVIPFFGSGAELLSCPNEVFAGLRTVLVNDADCFVANFWRSIREAPGEVARLCDEPVNEAEVEARHKWLVESGRKRAFAERVRDDAEFFDARAAAYWCYGLCSWFGGGWCAGEWFGRGDARNRGSGINTVHGKMPHVSSSMGVFRREVASPPPEGEGVRGYFERLRARLRGAKIVCGDWSRVVRHLPGRGCYAKGTTAVILDPPYSREAGRADVIYRCEDLAVAHRARAWAVRAARHRRTRLVLCGYEGEHPRSEMRGWAEVAWSAQGGLGVMRHAASRRAGGPGRGAANRHRERLWFSPACLAIDPAVLPGFARVAAHGPHVRRRQAGRRSAGKGIQ